MTKRMIAMFGVICLAFIIVFINISIISISPKYTQAATKQRNYTLDVSHHRGFIYDCNLIPLVNEVESNIHAIAPLPQNMQAILSAVPSKERSTLLSLMESGKPFITNIDSLSPSIKGVTTLQAFQRYQDQQLAPHIIGHLDNTDKTGVSGIEKAYNDTLTANSGKTTITYQTDGTGRILSGIDPIIQTQPLTPNGVVLTLDKNIQAICDAIGGRTIPKGSIVVMDPYTGEIKASSSFPSFSPNDVAKSIKDEKNAPLINRSFCSFTVGSTFKVVTASAAIEQGISPTQKYTCTGAIDVKGQIFKCHKLSGHGEIDMETAMIESCNPYFIALSQKLSVNEFRNLAQDFSFGKQYELAPFMYTQRGYLPTLEDLANPADIGNFSFGQGLLMATPIQVAQMMSCIINDGKTPTPSLVKGLYDPANPIVPQQSNNNQVNAIQKTTATLLKQFMIASVNQKEDSLSKPTLTTAGGKTATAQTGVMKEKKEMVHAWFAGFFPADIPKYVVVILYEDGITGNVSASPIFTEIADAITKGNY